MLLSCHNGFQVRGFSFYYNLLIKVYSFTNFAMGFYEREENEFILTSSFNQVTSKINCDSPLRSYRNPDFLKQPNIHKLWVPALRHSKDLREFWRNLSA